MNGQQLLSRMEVVQLATRKAFEKTMPGSSDPFTASYTPKKQKKGGKAGLSSRPRRKHLRPHRKGKTTSTGAPPTGKKSHQFSTI